MSSKYFLAIKAKILIVLLLSLGFLTFCVSDVKASSLSEVEVQLSSLKEQLLQLRGQLSTVSNGSSLMAASVNSGTFVFKSRITVLSATNVRSDNSVNSTLKGEQPVGAKGTIVAGPLNNQNLTWYYVNFDTGVSGWVRAYALSNIISPSTSAVINNTGTLSTTTVVSEEITQCSSKFIPASEVILHSGPSYSSTTIGSFTKGTFPYYITSSIISTVTNKSGEIWFKVNFPGSYPNHDARFYPAVSGWTRIKSYMQLGNNSLIYTSTSSKPCTQSVATKLYYIYPQAEDTTVKNYSTCTTLNCQNQQDRGGSRDSNISSPQNSSPTRSSGSTGSVNSSPQNSSPTRSSGSTGSTGSTNGAPNNGQRSPGYSGMV